MTAVIVVFTITVSATNVHTVCTGGKINTSGITDYIDDTDSGGSKTTFTYFRVGSPFADAPRALIDKGEGIHKTRTGGK